MLSEVEGKKTYCSHLLFTFVVNDLSKISIGSEDVVLRRGLYGKGYTLIPHL